MLRKWENLPDFMQTEAVRPYYNYLERRIVSLFLKRGFDIVVSFMMLIVLSPVLLVISILIAADSEGGVFFRQERVTQYGRKFRIHKFRTMVANAENVGTKITVKNDMRITKIGAKLRRTRLDELPQLIDILRGDMSFVGTRPEITKYVEQYTPEMYATLLLPAGVTSEASIRYKDEVRLLGKVENVDEVYVNEVLPGKMDYNLQSIRKFGLWREIRTMVRTIEAVWKKEEERDVDTRLKM